MKFYLFDLDLDPLQTQTPNLTYILFNFMRVLKMKFLPSVVQKLSSEQKDRQIDNTQTD